MHVENLMYLENGNKLDFQTKKTLIEQLITIIIFKKITIIIVATLI